MKRNRWLNFNELPCKDNAHARSHRLSNKKFSARNWVFSLNNRSYCLGLLLELEGKKNPIAKHVIYFGH